MTSTAVRADITTHLRALTAPASAAEIAAALGRARSTVTAALRDLEQAGQAVRTPGGYDHGRRQPDLWEAARSDDPVEASKAVLADDAPAPDNGVGVAPTHASAAGSETDAARGAAVETPTTPEPGVAPQTPVALNPVTKTARLEPGALREMVRAILHASPGKEFSPIEISHLLRGRSVGAIQNALARLVRDGQAVLTCEAPRRYSAA
ncbi:transcriptional regulator [Streptomonospora sp. S1-112]|uniref:Transcriptional regulator n=1 Tax=Streptomonospora mangrovi TaxID=2883123 RepID=A0A9X3SN54_9ACTN|nr:transcriptional regulator [Streptomonospora mangrovi]MDA0564851.1 transcriptional regulator [Streptomonospora mangrovi]